VKTPAGTEGREEGSEGGRWLSRALHRRTQLVPSSRAGPAVPARLAGAGTRSRGADEASGAREFLMTPWPPARSWDVLVGASPGTVPGLGPLPRGPAAAWREGKAPASGLDIRAGLVEGEEGRSASPPRSTLETWPPHGVTAAPAARSWR